MKFNPPKTARDYMGREQKINYPRGSVLANAGMVTLIQQSKNQFAVCYGLQITLALARDAAADEFGQCCFHQAECEGLMQS